MEDIKYDFWAASLQDGYIGNLSDIIKKAGGSYNLYKMTPEEMTRKLGLSKRMINHIINRRNSFEIEKEYEKMMRQEIRFIRETDMDFPYKLKNINSCPYAIFVKGELPKDNAPSVAIVGARECSEYGRLMAEYFGDRLSRRGISIVSGMAFGIDGIAQMAAVNAGGKSYAVLGCGVDEIYPKSNRVLYEKLINSGGIISEYVPGTSAMSRNFPPRNRIISGLSDAIIVVEAKAKSGTLITADLAMDQGREVLIIPGRITDPLSVGCMNLIKTGATPITCIEDVLDHLPNMNILENEDEKNIIKTIKLTAEEKILFDCLDYYSKSIEELSLLTKYDISTLIRLTTEMEMKGLIKCTSQTSFVKTS